MKKRAISVERADKMRRYDENRVNLEIRRQSQKQSGVMDDHHKKKSSARTKLSFFFVTKLRPWEGNEYKLATVYCVFKDIVTSDSLTGRMIELKKRVKW